MALPKGMQPSYPNQVYKLLKSLYGLKQSSMQWFAKLSTIFISNNFTQCVVDNSPFIHKFKTSFTALLIYVDDLIIAGNNLEINEHIKNILHHHFHFKDLGNLKCFLGLEVARSKSGININKKSMSWTSCQLLDC